MNGAEFKAMREGAGITIAEAARAVGVKWATIWRWETGRRYGVAHRGYGEGFQGGLPSGAVDWLREESARRSGAPGGLSGDGGG